MELDTTKKILKLTLFLSPPIQVEMTGSSIFDYVHQSDHVELAEQLGVTLAHHHSHHQQQQQQRINNNTEMEAKAMMGSIPSIPDGEKLTRKIFQLGH